MKKQMTLFKAIASATILTGMTFVSQAEEAPASTQVSSLEILQQKVEVRQELRKAGSSKNYKKLAKLYDNLAQSEPIRSQSAAYLTQSADALLSAHKLNQAFAAYKRLMMDYPLNIKCDHVVDQLRIVARWYEEGNGTLLNVPDENSAIKVYEFIIREAPAATITEFDRLSLADLFIKMDRKPEAVAIYQDILNKEPNNTRVRAWLAMLLLDMSKFGDSDGSALRSAVREAKTVIANDPDFEAADRMKDICTTGQEKEANRLLRQARFYNGIAHKRPEVARRYLNDILVKYPDTDAAAKAKDILAAMPAEAQPAADDK